MNVSTFRTSLLSAALALSLGLGATPAMATAVFSAASDARLTIAGVSSVSPGLVISGLTFDDPQDSAVGNSTANGVSLSTVDAVDAFDMLPGDGLSLFAGSDGDARAAGSALADTFTDGEIFFDNQTGGTVTIMLSLDFDLDANAGVTDPSSEFAFAFASVELFGGSIDVFDEAQSDSDLGGGPDSYSDTFLFEFSLTPGESELITARVSTFGIAQASPLAAPTTQWMLLFGLLVMKGRRSSGRSRPTRRPQQIE